MYINIYMYIYIYILYSPGYGGGGRQDQWGGGGGGGGEFSLTPFARAVVFSCILVCAQNPHTSTSTHVLPRTNPLAHTSTSQNLPETMKWKNQEGPTNKRVCIQGMTIMEGEETTGEVYLFAQCLTPCKCLFAKCSIPCK